MKGIAPDHKLTQEHKFKVCELLSQFYPVPEIIKTIKKNHDIDISTSTVIFYSKSPKWVPVIDRMRNEYISNVMEIEVTCKSCRNKVPMPDLRADKTGSGWVCVKCYEHQHPDIYNKPQEQAPERNQKLVSAYIKRFQCKSQ